MTATTTEVLHEQNRFYKVVNGMESHMDYELHQPSTVVFYHTYVPEELRGKGLAKEIIREGLDWAMSEHLDIIPACSAVRRFIDMNEDYKAYFNK
jgi:predicted GNAT family acetyltransferase